MDRWSKFVGYAVRKLRTYTAQPLSADPLDRFLPVLRLTVIDGQIRTTREHIQRGNLLGDHDGVALGQHYGIPAEAAR